MRSNESQHVSGEANMKSLNFYTTKYNLNPDPILDLDELLQMDDRLSSIKQRSDSGQLVNLKLKDFQKAVSGAIIIPSVPESVHTAFNGAKQLFIFGYFEYYFLSISLHYLFLAIESALRNKHKEMYGEPKRFMGLKKVIKELSDKCVISDKDKSTYLSIPNMRNEMSHLTQPTIIPAQYKMFERIAEMINQLYDE